MEVKNKEDVKEVKKMGDVKEVESLPFVAFALIISVISLILTFLAGIIWFIVGYAALHSLSTVIISLNTNSTAVVNSVAGSITAMGALYLIIVWPIMAFIMTFIGAAIVAILYNVLAPRIGGIKLGIK
jgi:Transmembrane domain of unknown function (DUF3566)